MKAKLLIVSVVAAASIAVPVASSAERVPGGPGAGGPVLESELSGQAFVGGPGAGGPVLATDVFGVEPIGGPGAGGPVLPATRIAADEFDWVAAGIGVAFALGVALAAAGLLLRARQRTTSAMPQH